MSPTEPVPKKTHLLGELASTAICGNDITSSCLYVSALAILYAGRWAPLSLLLVAAVLYLFRSIYGEVVGALPLNGGAYNALLNTTSKFRASIAACLTILSYMATAVLSAHEAMNYIAALWAGWPIMSSTIVLLAIFMGLTILGISESSIAAIVIFIIHISTLIALIVSGVIFIATQGFDVLLANFRVPNPHGWPQAIFFGFAAAMLGISGFESSANFVEEQKPGVFPKTLRNMWIAVSIFNPLTALLALALVPISQVAEHSEALLAHMGGISGGHWLSTLISIDATLVLSGAVLTSFVGVNGLVRRMTLDRCLPQHLLKVNRRGSSYRIIITFFLLCLSVLAITRGNLRALAGVYTISFLCVMILFGIGNVLLKVKRSHLRRPIRASWLGVFAAIGAILLALLGNAIMNPTYLKIFLQYFVPTALVVAIMLERIAILHGMLFLMKRYSATVKHPPSMFTWMIREKIHDIISQQVVFFTRGDNISNLNQAMLYVLENEHTNRIKIVTILKDCSLAPPRLEQDLKLLDEIYPRLSLEYVQIQGEFGPALIQELSEKWKIPPNFMFLGTPSGKLIYGLAELGGVRLII